MKKLILSGIARGYSVIVALLLSVVIAQVLPVESAAGYFNGIAVVGVCSLFVRMGLDTLIQKEIVSSPNNPVIGNRILGNGFFYILLSCLIIPLAAIVLYPLRNKLFPSGGMAYIYFLAAVFGLTIIWLASGVMKGYGKAPLANFLEVGSVPTLLVVLLLSFNLLIDINYSQAAVIYLVAVCSIAIISAVSLYNNSKPTGVSYPRIIDIKVGAQIMLASMLDFLTLWLSVLISAMLIPADDVANLHVALRISMLVAFILAIINTITSPIYARYFRENRHDDVEVLMQMSSALMTTITIIPIVILVWFDGLITELYGDAYSQAHAFLCILIIGQFVNIYSGSVGYVLIMSGNEHVYRKNTQLGFWVTLLLIFSLTPVLSGYGTAIAMSAGLALKNIAGVFKVRKILKIDPTPSLINFKNIIMFRESYEVFNDRH